MVTLSMLLAAAICAVEIRWDTAALRLDDRGYVTALTDSSTGDNFALPGQPFCRIDTEESTLLPSGVARRGDTVRFEFPSGASLTFRIATGKGFSYWRLASLDGVDMDKVKALGLAAVKVRRLEKNSWAMNCTYDANFAVGVMCAEINVWPHRADVAAQGDAPAGVVLAVDTLKAHGITPGAFGIIACPRKRLEATIDAFEKAADLPNPHPGGAWSKISPLAKRDYLFITAFGEKDTDDLIRWAKRGDFPMILIGGESWSVTSGHYEINTKFFPDGLASLKRTFERLRAAGLRVGLHFLAAAVYVNDPYVTPKPDPRLFKDAWAELAETVDEKATFIPTAAPPEGFPTEDGGYMGKGMCIQIDDELIHYSEVRTEPPYGFAGCSRGYHGTVPAAHTKGARIAHLMRSYGYYLYDLDSSLADEVIGAACRTINAVRADMLYFDGSELLQGDHWYYNAKMQNAYYRRLVNKDTFIQASSYSPYSWHLISRMASADGHGDLKKYLDDRMPWFADYEANLMPLDIGWYYLYDPETTADQFEYILQKALGWGATISLQSNPQNLREHPEAETILDLISTYSRLRRSGLVPEETRKLLREAGREYRLLRNPLRLRRTVYGPWQTVAGLGEKGAEFQLEPAMEQVRLGVQIRCGGLVRPGAAYYAPQAALLETFDNLAPYLKEPSQELNVLIIGPEKAGWTSQGVTQELAIEEGGVDGGRCARYTATSTRSDSLGWSCMMRRLAGAPVDLSWHKAIGFWLRGDGGGGAFKLQLRDDRYATDYYIINDFTEWRYFQLLRPTQPQPEPIDYSKVQYLAIYYNGLPAKKTVTVWIDDVKALAELDEAAVVNPSVVVGQERVVFPVTLREGERLVWFPGAAPEVIPAKLGPRRRLPAPKDIVLTGPGTVRVTGEGAGTALAKIRFVQDCPEEIRLPEKALAGSGASGSSATRAQGRGGRRP